MGEYSKRVGEVGESVVAEFLELIGWHQPMRNIDIESIDLEFRKRSNGLDGYFHYVNPMISNTIENVLYSCKYSGEPYPTSQLVKMFKEYYFELSKVIESFKKSQLKQSTLSLHDNIDSSFDRGILFWLNNSGQDDNDLLSKLSRIELTPETNHDGIFLVDNSRIEFIYDSINFALLNYRDYDVDFMYFNNGLNNAECNLRNGKIMPIQYINSSVLPLRANKGTETIIMIFTIDKFSSDELAKYMGIAKNIGCNAQGKTLIGFPDYLETKHLPDVNRIKNSLKDPSFTSNLLVVNYNNNLLR